MWDPAAAKGDVLNFQTFLESQIVASSTILTASADGHSGQDRLTGWVGGFMSGGWGQVHGRCPRKRGGKKKKGW